MRRFTILNLMGFVLALALGLAALRGANDYWASGLLLGTPLLLCVALVGGLCGVECARAPRLGFAVFGGAYFAIALLGLSEGSLGNLPTSRLLAYVHEKVAGTLPFNVTFTSSVGSVVPGGSAGNFVVMTVPPVQPPASLTTAKGAGQLLTFSNVAVNGKLPNSWLAVMPGAMNNEAFSTVGHCLFALLAGLLGAIIARRFEKRRLTSLPT
jgi:hypothetical protein